jgi:hypothetical protein
MPLSFPLRIRRLHDHNGELVQVAIIDALDRRICFYAERRELRREVAKLWSPEDAEALAVHIARFLTDRWAEQVVIHQNASGEKKR